MSKDMLAKIAIVGVSFVAWSVYAQGPSPAPSGAATQGGPQGTTAETERVIVTGSNIPTAEEVGPNPVFQLNRDLINKSGQGTTVEELLKSQPVSGASNVPVQNNGTGQAGPIGTSSVSLRGFDAGATLVLVDGRRVAAFPGAANSGYGFNDLFTIPVSAVQSVEILKDGASTTYGADAVAGVVNFKLWKDFRGVQVTTQYGNTLDKDAAIFNTDVLFGVGNENTSITGDLFYYHHNSMFNHDRGNSAVPPFLSSNSYPWQFQVSTDVALASGATVGTFGVPGQIGMVTDPDTGNLVLPARVYGTPQNGASGTSSPSTYLYNSPARVRGAGGLLPDQGWNFNSTSSSFPREERWGGYTAFSHKLCGDQLQAYADFFYVDAKTHDELAPNATGSFQTPGSPTIFVPPGTPFTNDISGAPGGPPALTPTASQVGMPAGAFNPFNPFQQIISGGSRARLLEFGNRLLDSENQGWRTTAGLKGDKLFDGNWGYDAAFMYSQVQQTAEAQFTSAPRFQRILNAADSLFDPASGDFIGQTTPFNPFAGVRLPTNAPLVDFALSRTRDLLTSKLATLDLNIYTTELFKLPGGPVGFAFGGLFSREDYHLNPDDQNRLGQVQGAAREDPIHAGRKKYGLYAEASVPFIGPEMGVPGFHTLEFTYAGRYEEFRNNDTNAAVPKVGMRWQPLDDSLTIRSTWGEGLLEPSLVQLNGPTRFLLAPVHFVGFAPAAVFGPPGSRGNAAQDVTDPETTLQQIPNPNLSPEHDRTFTAGIVYTPKLPAQWGTLTLSVDLWDVERSGVVMFRSPQSIINAYNAGQVPGVISPEEPTGTAVLFDPTGGYSGVSSPYLNGGRENARGVDFGVQYGIETGIGTFSSLTRVSYLDQFVFQFPGDIAHQVAGRSNTDFFAGSFFGDVTSGDGWLKWKGTSTLDWTWHNFDLNTTLHLLDGFWEQIYAKNIDIPAPPSSVDGFKQHYVHPTWFTDAQLSYSFIFTPPMESQPVAGYSKDAKEVVRGKDGKAVDTGQTANYSMPCWKNLMNNTTFTVGVNNIFGEDPPQAFGFEAVSNSVNYPGSLYDNLGRFVYVRLVKKF